MAHNDKLSIFPSRANSVLVNQRIASAKRGMGLLKRKKDAIDMKLREIKRQMAEKEEYVDNNMRAAIFSVAKAKLIGTDFKPIIVADSKVASTSLCKRQLKIVGVSLNYFELETGDEKAFPLAGLSCGGLQVRAMREKFYDALVNLVDYASHEYMVRMLTDAKRQTNTRMSALEHVILPRLQNTYSYICGELEEFEREDFYRLKRSQTKQLEVKVAFTEMIKTKNLSPEELLAYRKRGNKMHPKADVGFDSDEFDDHVVQSRALRARKQRQKRGEEPRNVYDSQDRKSISAIFSSFITSQTIVEMMEITNRSRRNTTSVTKRSIAQITLPTPSLPYEPNQELLPSAAPGSIPSDEPNQETIFSAAPGSNLPDETYHDPQ